jgi:iron complex transport system substrate-binding protein
MPAQRIASLLPSATEICFAVGLGDRLVGVSHECDFPAPARTLPHLTRAGIADASSRDIHEQVRARLGAGLSLYAIDEARLQALAPDLVVTQDVCAVCAISRQEVERCTATLLGRDTEVLALAPRSIADVFADVERVGRAAGVGGAARAVTHRLHRRLDALSARVAGRPRPRVLLLEWLDPPMAAGHWTPELLERAGGLPVLGHPGRPTVATSWEALAASDPDVVLLAPCGFSTARTLRELPAIWPQLSRLRAVAEGRCFVADGSAYFNRPGPRLVDSAYLAACALHPQLWPDFRPTESALQRAPAAAHSGTTAGAAAPSAPGDRFASGAVLPRQNL